jgi:alkylated DNA repair dioxygenase AlkB
MNIDKIKKPISGLTIIPKFITKNEEKTLIKEIENNEWNNDLKRLTQQYGYKYNYKTRNITNDDYIAELPNWTDLIIDKIMNTNLITNKPDQIIINRYLPKEGISAHVDSKLIFKNQIYSVSLGSGTTIKFKNEEKTHIIYLPKRTLLIMEDDARYKYTHEIEKNINDTVKVNGIKKQRKRKTRYSMTFRNVIKTKL